MARKNPSPFQSEQDQWQQQMWDAVAMAIGSWLTDSEINLGRPIRSQRREELLGMAWAGIGTRNDLRVQRARELENGPGPRQLTLPGISAI